jgi:ribosomal protein L14E/L6E/L27E
LHRSTERFVEVGRVVLVKKTQKLAIIVEIVDTNKVRMETQLAPRPKTERAGID